MVYCNDEDSQIELLLGHELLSLPKSISFNRVFYCKMNSERRQEGCKIYQNLAPKNNLRGHLALQQKDMSGSLKAKWGMFGAFWFNVEY